MVNLKVSVTKNDIKRGHKSCPVSCPIFLALSRAGFKNHHVGIGRLMLRHRIWDYEKAINFPIEVSNFVEDLDNGKKVKPFKFTLKIADRKARAFGLAI
jgi:hypothetical protein